MRHGLAPTFLPSLLEAVKKKMASVLLFWLKYKKKNYKENHLLLHTAYHLVCNVSLDMLQIILLNGKWI